MPARWMHPVQAAPRQSVSGPTIRLAEEDAPRAGSAEAKSSTVARAVPLM